MAASLLLVLAGVGTGLALIVSEIRCDSTCNDPGVEGRWAENGDAWQWHGQAGLAAIGFLLAVLALGLTFQRRYQAAGAAWITAAAIYGSWALFLHEQPIGGF